MMIFALSLELNIIPTERRIVEMWWSIWESVKQFFTVAGAFMVILIIIVFSILGFYALINLARLLFGGGGC